MMKITGGNILDDDVEALVNTVNTKGVMGKGIALQFKQAFPANYEAYRRACSKGEVRIGEMFMFRTGLLGNPKWIINFPTKNHWRTPSKIEYVQRGMEALGTALRTYNIRSIAIPPLGAGNGGLDWAEVRPVIEKALRQLPDVRAVLHEPRRAPMPSTMRVATKAPRMTAARAALIAILGRYGIPGYRLALVEIQKLAYFLQAAGEPLRLGFVKGQYGPYAETLNYVLQRLEGHYIRGYGDRSQASPIQLMEAAVDTAAVVLCRHSETKEHLEEVESLIEGFETPYGLELLASVHWVASVENSMAKKSAEIAVELVHAWSKRKAHRFNPEHIHRAWQRLQALGWMERLA